ncbi:RNA polymerase sigma factor [Stygiobacter electus]|uniref:RNA polymerase sigma factor n=1 Tax=Stygiobacter electus TaxID=3032292 RepID=A0AAE3NZ01_9BACT|nr:RNA polymerase sigma factor [Stygiobacter electus]MDF1611079.1 RNA polymerase sigma factor [Stygiobacter electus]
MEREEDYILVKRYLEGDESAFNEIVKKYQKRIYWHARQMLGNHLDADEVTQEVLIVMYKKLKTFNFQSNLFTWIYKIVTTRSINQIRRNQVKKFFSINDEENPIDIKSDNDIIEDLSNKEKIERLNKALEKLPSKQRQVFVMRNFDELSYEEISKITGKSVGGLKANYFHALKKIMGQLDGKE